MSALGQKRTNDIFEAPTVITPRIARGGYLAPWDFDVATARNQCTRRCIESLPVLAVKIFRLQRREVNIIDAACIDVDLVRIRAWHIERMDAAVPAERVLGHASVKRVGRKIIFAAEQLEPLWWHDQMDDALLGADRAIADDDRVEIGSDAKAHALTVTAAFVRSQLIHCRLGRTNRTASAHVAARLTVSLSSLVPGNKIQMISERKSAWSSATARPNHLKEIAPPHPRP
jgi:hypothetical protein